MTKAQIQHLHDLIKTENFAEFFETALQFSENQPDLYDKILVESALWYDAQNCIKQKIPLYLKNKNRIPEIIKQDLQKIPELQLSQKPNKSALIFGIIASILMISSLTFYANQELEIQVSISVNGKSEDSLQIICSNLEMTTVTNSFGNGKFAVPRMKFWEMDSLNFQLHFQEKDTLFRVPKNEKINLEWNYFIAPPKPKDDLENKPEKIKTEPEIYPPKPQENLHKITLTRNYQTIDYVIFEGQKYPVQKGGIIELPDVLDKEYKKLYIHFKNPEKQHWEKEIFTGIHQIIIE